MLGNELWRMYHFYPWNLAALFAVPGVRLRPLSVNWKCGWRGEHSRCLLNKFDFHMYLGQTQDCDTSWYFGTPKNILKNGLTTCVQVSSEGSTLVNRLPITLKRHKYQSCHNITSCRRTKGGLPVPVPHPWMAIYWVGHCCPRTASPSFFLIRYC